MKRGHLRSNIEVQEGDVFAVPLPDGGYGRVVVSRKDRRGGVFGYFFGPRYDGLPSGEGACRLNVDESVFCEIFSDLGIQEKLWPLLGRIEPWNRGQWPLPSFGRIADDRLRIAYIDTYINEDLDHPPVQRRCTPEEARRYPAEGLSGDRAAANTLAKLLRGEKVPW